MTTSLEQSVKEKLRTLAHSKRSTFAELWRNLVLERFLARLYGSAYRTHFILKGGSLLARYIPLGRETKDLDFLVRKLANTEKKLIRAFDEICSIDLQDGFVFSKFKIGLLTHPHMDYIGTEVVLIAKFGGTKTHLKIDLGFGDVVDPVDYTIDLIATSKGPLYESRIQVRCYPKEFIFAEKLETVVFRSASNSRMKDFHDLYSLVIREECLNPSYTKKAIKMVFTHRNASFEMLPISFDQSSLDRLQEKWDAYHQGLSLKQDFFPPKELENVIYSINQWLIANITTD